MSSVGVEGGTGAASAVEEVALAGTVNGVLVDGGTSDGSSLMTFETLDSKLEAESTNRSGAKSDEAKIDGEMEVAAGEPLVGLQLSILVLSDRDSTEDSEAVLVNGLLLVVSTPIFDADVARDVVELDVVDQDRPGMPK